MKLYGMATSTNAGVTITMQQSIIDNYNGYLSFKVEGYEVPEGEEPTFETVEIDLDTGDNSMYSYGFYDGIIIGEDGKGVYEDGSALRADENDNLIVNYQLEDGTLEYWIRMFSTDENGGFAGKPIHVELKDLGIYQETEERVDAVKVDVEGSWSFDWTLQASKDIQSCTLNAMLGESGATVTAVEISPITMKVLYELPRQVVQEEGINEATGETQMFSFYEEPPMLTGVRLKDGTLFTRVFTGGEASGYVDEESDTYQVIAGANRILDVEEIDALLFVKSYPESEGGVLTEENLYIVPLE